jgi:hypothetical protein
MDLRQIIKRVLLESEYLGSEVEEYLTDYNMQHEIKKLHDHVRVFLRRKSKLDDATVSENRKDIMGTILEYIHMYLDQHDRLGHDYEEFNQKDDERGTPEFDNKDRKELLKKLKSIFSQYLETKDNTPVNERIIKHNRQKITNDLNNFIGMYLDFSKDEDINESVIYEDSYGSVQNTPIRSTGMLNEAEYQGRKVQLGKIMQGDIKKFKVYVKNDKGKVVKVNFGFGGKSAKGKRMVIKKNNPARRKSFRARMNCDNPGPRWKPRYWACRTW